MPAPPTMPRQDSVGAPPPPILAASSMALPRLDANERAEYWAGLALRHTDKLGPRSIRRLLEHFGSALEAVQQVAAWTAAGVHPHRASSLLTNQWRETAIQEWNAAKTVFGHIVLWTSPDYPPPLRELIDAPVLFYARGDLSLLHAPCLAIVGKRKCSEEGLRAATYFARNLAEAGVTIVSGMALGVDQAAHQAAVGHTGSTIAVLGTGVDVPYPQAARQLHATLAKKGLLVSEFAPGTPPVPANFPIRNRIISGLSLGVLVVEAAPRSGSLITARMALEQNRCVFAVPGSLGAPTAQGCQDLIRQGARPAFAVRDILEELFPQLRSAAHADDPPPPPAATEAEAPPTRQRGTLQSQATPPSMLATGATGPTVQAPAPCPPLQGDEARLVQALHQPNEAAPVPMSIDALSESLDLPSARLSALLIQLEIRGLVRRLPGQYYTLPA